MTVLSPFPCPFLVKPHPCLFYFCPSFCPNWDLWLWQDRKGTWKRGICSFWFE